MVSILVAALLGTMPLQKKAFAASLVIYGPGGPYQAIRECADIFADARGLTADVRADEPSRLADRAAKDGDVYYTGAEYMMQDFLRAYPGVLDDAAIILPAARRVGVIVRPGNPRGIRNLDDLAAPGVRILDVSLENMSELRGAANANTAVSVATGRQGLATWKASHDLDAWVTYKTWAEQLGSGEGEFLPINDAQGVRRIPVTVMRNAPHPELASAFLEFLATDAARAVFLNNGYEPY